MTWNDVKNNWPKVQEQVHARWAKITDAEIKTIAGDKPQLVSCLQRHYQLDRSVAEQQADEFVVRLR